MTTSVAICTYNGSKYLSKQLESFINQTKPVDEIIICDDGSTDSTSEIINQFIKNNPYIKMKFIKNPFNLGYMRNFEQAISLCSSDIIFLSDQDDIWMNDKVEIICNFFIDNKDKDFVFTNAVLINNSDINSYRKDLFQTIGWDKKNKKLFDDGFAYDILNTSARITGATTAIRASFIPYCIPFPYSFYATLHDEMMAVSAAIYNKIGYIEKPLIKYRLHNTQAVGLSILFKFPPKRIELSLNSLMWHDVMVNNNDNYRINHIRFVNKRFWTFRSKFGFIKLFTYYFSGEYNLYYSKPYIVFLRDLKSSILNSTYKIYMFFTTKGLSKPELI
ncbi:MAG: glycosyltransferase family 2 protein [Bacteroidales bacterium]|jgi:glycosyltransferase involved in cell wall biosynthesis|nr:glycosyltransferase family 2 protein [Bacteroidales bacterium]